MSQSLAGLAGLLVLALGACTQPQTLSESARQAVADSVGHQVDAFAAAVAARSGDDLAGLFTEDPDFVYADEGRFYPSRQALRDAARNFFGGIRSAGGHWDPRLITVLGPDAATFTGIFRAELVDTLGQPRWADGKLWTLVFHRREGRWTIVQAHESNARAQASE